jgi:lysophospholipase L1-like esterase
MATAIQIPKPRPASRLRAFAINTAVLSASILIGVLLLEFLVRIVAPQQLIVARPELYRPDNILGWAHRANAKTVLNTGDGPVHFRTDANGYRIPWTGSTDDPHPQTRILMLGDSFLESTAVEAESTIPELLKNRLQKRLAIDNTGVGGWDPNQYLIQAKLALSKQKYDLGIVLLYLGNDLMTKRADRYPPRRPSQLHSFRLPHSLRWKEWIAAVLYPFNDMLKTRSHLYLFLKTRMEVPLSRLGLTEYYFPEVFALADRKSRRWDVTTQICDSIRQEFAAHGAPTIFVILPTAYQVDPRIFQTYVRSFKINRAAVDLDQPNKLLDARFRAASLDFIDPLPQMRRQNAAGTQLFGKVDRHLNAAGEAAVADMLAPAIRAVLP